MSEVVPNKELPYWRTEAFLRARGFDTNKIAVHGFSALGYEEFVYDEDGKRQFVPSGDHALTIHRPWPEDFPVSVVLDLFEEDRKNG